MAHIKKENIHMGRTFYSTPEEYAKIYLNNKMSKERVSKEIKFEIISLAYSCFLSKEDLSELSEIFSAISKRTAQIKRKDYK